MNGSCPLVTVVVCTYNRAELLGLCLEALDRQDAVPGAFAVSVVNNCCTDATSRVVADHAAAAPYPLRELLEEYPGASHARNRGVGECDSPWVAFLDDDARPHADWVRSILAFIADHPDAAIFGGPVLPYYLTPPPAWLPAEVGRFWHGDRVVRLPYRKYFLAGGNLVTRREAFEAVGGFDRNLGPRGDDFHYGEDTAFYRQAIAKGLPVYYTPDVVVDHLVRPEKYTLVWHVGSLRELGMNLARRLGPFASLPAALILAVLSPLLAFCNFGVFLDIPLKRRVYYALHPMCYAWGMLSQVRAFTARAVGRWCGKALSPRNLPSWTGRFFR